MTETNLFTRAFGTAKPILGMLHLKGMDRADRLRRAVHEAYLLDAAGFDGLIVENYFGDENDVEAALGEIGRFGLRIRIGLNLLGNTAGAFRLAESHKIDFIQIDSICGHLPPDLDAIYADEIAERRPAGIPLLGGVRFKYQPVLSGRDEAEDVRIGAARADAIVITGAGTGMETEADKIGRFRAAAPEGYPLIVGAGLTAGNLAEQFHSADGGIIGSWIKEGHRDSGEMWPAHLSVFMDELRKIRMRLEKKQREASGPSR